MTSKVHICNFALARLGSTTNIISLTDDTNEARLCNTFYDDIVEETIVEGGFSTARRRASLAQTVNTPLYGFAYEFQLPVDPKCLKVLTINESEPGNYSYCIEGDKLLIDISSVDIQYLSFLDNPDDYGPNLKRTIISRLAAELAYPITGQPQITSAMFNIYEKTLASSMAIDSQQGSGEDVSHSLLDQIRP